MISKRRGWLAYSITPVFKIFQSQQPEGQAGMQADISARLMSRC
jgi:hypothetical protein